SGAFAHDPYVMRHKPRSLLCLPIVSRGDVIAVLYLENKLVSGAFTPELLDALEVIAAQAAIALANADLFAKLERENAERRRPEGQLRRSVALLQAAERDRDRLLVDERRARAAAEQAVRMRDEFLSVASHELRTPLTSLQLAIQGLSRRLPADVAPPITR